MGIPAHQKDTKTYHMVGGLDIDDGTAQELKFKAGVLNERLSSQLGKLTHADIIVSGSYSDNNSRLNIETVYHNATNGQTIFRESMIASPKAIAKVAEIAAAQKYIKEKTDEGNEIARENRAILNQILRQLDERSDRNED